MKNFCEKHHLSFNGTHCPCCEKERIGNMLAKFGKYIVNNENTKTVGNYSKKSSEKYYNPDLNWDDLAEKFNIVKSK